MTDSSKYINNYIDILMGTLHENLATLIQTKTQLKVVNDVISERDATIAALSNEISMLKSNSSIEKENITKNNEELEELRRINTHLENEVNFLQNEVVNLRQNNTNQEDSVRKSNEELERLRARNTELEGSFISLQGKISHMDTLLNQISQMKNSIIERDVEISNLKREKETEIDKLRLEKDTEISNLKVEIDQLKAPAKKLINNKSKTKTLPLSVDARLETEKNDF